MKEPKIIEIAVLLLAVLYATLSWNIHHILDYIFTNFTSYYIYIYIYIYIYDLYDLYTPQIESTDPQTSQLSADVASWRSFASTAEMLMLTAPGLTKMLALSEKALWSYRTQMIPNGPNLHKASKHLRQCSGPCLLSARPSRMPILEASMAIIHSVAMDRYPCPKAMLLASSFRKTKDACLVIGYLREDMRYLLPRR